MARLGKWLGIGIAGVLMLLVIAAAYVYVASELAMRRKYDIPLTTYTAPTDAGSIERGKRIATLSGCNGCHGKNMEGVSPLFNEPNIARIDAPNLTHKLREYSDPELERLLRHGLKRDGTSTWVMPVPMFSQLSEQDFNDLVAFLRSVPVQAGESNTFEFRALGRLGIALGQFRPIVAQVDHSRPRIATADRSDALKYGEYLANTTCTECHGASFEGSELIGAPNLLIAQAYSEEDFFRLMRTGRGLGNRELGLMTEVAEVRFTLFTDEEVRAVRNYLLQRAQGQQTLAAGNQ
jgi:cytochrome c553